jgi:hypothetical protein
VVASMTKLSKNKYVPPLCLRPSLEGPLNLKTFGVK